MPHATQKANRTAGAAYRSVSRLRRAHDAVRVGQCAQCHHNSGRKGWRELRAEPSRTPVLRVVGALEMLTVAMSDVWATLVYRKQA